MDGRGLAAETGGEGGLCCGVGPKVGAAGGEDADDCWDEAAEHALDALGAEDVAGDGHGTGGGC